MERKKLIDIEEKEILRKEKELIATVKRPAEAQAYKVETIAEGQRWTITNRLQFFFFTNDVFLTH